MSAPRSATKSTPDDLTITPRDIHFVTQAARGQAWLGGDAVATAVFNAMSLTFPDGERLFMDAVRHYRGELSGKLLAGVPVAPVLVQIDYDNAVFVNHERTDPERVIASVTRYRAETPDAPVLMDVQDMARHGLIVGIWDDLADKQIPTQIHRSRAGPV